MPKRVFVTYAAFVCDKIGDIKVVKIIAELLLALAECMTPKFIATQMVKWASKSKNVKNLEESCNVLVSLCAEFGAGQLPVPQVLAYNLIAVGNANKKVRDAAMKLYTELYKHMGEMLRTFLTDIKESTMKLIDAELSKVTPYKKGEF